jgi:hypothetical protein
LTKPGGVTCGVIEAPVVLWIVFEEQIADKGWTETDVEVEEDDDDESEEVEVTAMFKE